MAQQKTTNTFIKGMVSDLNELDTPNDVLTSALNATMGTFNGNEGVLQNDMGNVKVGIPNSDIIAQLNPGYTPVGSVEYGGVIYIASTDSEGNCEIGSMPSPDYTTPYGELLFNYKPLHVGQVKEDNVLVDCELNTKLFKFSTEHPVNILAEEAFDGSVNLILNDGVNVPRLINTGFHAQDNNHYEIIKRIGTNNTNRYNLIDKTNQTLFDLETSLYKDTDSISNFVYEGTSDGGELKVGNYVFYAITCDKDGNESDIIAESGVVSIFKGTEGDPFSVNGGISDERTDKAVKLRLTNIDDAYRYIKIFYTRTTASNNLSASTLAYKLDKLFPVIDKECKIVITGLESNEGIGTEDLNIQYFNADMAKALAISSNILFLGNIKEKNIASDEYLTLRELSLQIVPYCSIDQTSFKLDRDYNNGNESYYNSQFIYNKTGYHAGEIYRFGIVYIRQDNSLTSVFDVLGVKDLFIDKEGTKVPTRPIIKEYPSESGFYLSDSGAWVLDITDYNSKGVCRIPENSINNLTDIIGISFSLPNNFTETLKTTYKGYFFVRLKRIPTMLALGYATNICEESFLPSINISKTDSTELTHTVLSVNPTTLKLEDLEESNKLYLYESFASGAFQTNGEPYDDSKTVADADTNFYPKRSTKKVTNTLKLVNNYRSRLFTLSDYTYQYLDKMLGDGPVSTFLNEMGTLSKSMFLAPGWENIEYKKDNQSPVEEYLFTYYATPEKWDDSGKSDGSSGRTLLCTNDKSSTDVNLYLHGFKKTNVSFDPNNLYKIYFDVNEDDLSYNYIKETSDNIRLAEYIEEKSEKDENGQEVTIPSHWQEWNKKGNALNFLTIFCTEESEYGVNNDNNKGYVLSKSNKISFAASKKGSYRYTEILAMALSPDKSYNAGLGFDFYCSKDLTKVYLYDGSDLYEPYCAFFGHGGNSWALSVDNIILAVNKYIKIKEPKQSNADSQSLLKKDPTIPTFDGKYGLTSDTDEDEFRVALSPIEYGSYGVYCPEFELDLPYYNSVFTGKSLKVLPITTGKLLSIEDNFKTRRYTYNNIKLEDKFDYLDSKAIALQENVTVRALQKDKEIENNNAYWPRAKTNYFSSKASDASEIGFKFVGGKSLSHVYYNKNCWPDEPGNKFTFGKVNIAAPFNIVRGIYGPYVGVCTYKSEADSAKVVDISDKIVGFYIPGYSTNNMLTYFNIRIEDPTSYYAISDRISLSENTSNLVYYRGDCYINWYTHRINRNFNDSVAPYNDTIIDGGSFSAGFEKCFDSEYRTFDLTSDAEAANKFNIGDLNAVLLGSWVTFPVRSTMNTALRSDDGATVGEVLACGHNRTFYPLHALDASGSNKIPESEAFNSGYNKSGGERLYRNVELEVFVGTYYRNRIIYSNVKLDGTFTNGHRTFIATHFRDYTDLYGEIVKLIDLGSGLLVVCEHGIFTVAVNEKQLLAEGNGSNVYLNTNNVLSDTPEIVSDMYGSTWPESIIKTPYGIFGVDENSKKIWYTNGTRSSFTLISDRTVQKFLNEHLFVKDSLKINRTNIKSHYNAYKNDVMFTLYDYNPDKIVSHDLMWNLCFNLNDNLWKTFYSWIPIESLNIGNNFISLDLFEQDKYFWKHGQSLRVPGIERIQPTNWYGKTHPFEFEFVVRENPEVSKLFDNIQIIANKTEPESFHYEIVGESYDFSDLKENAYYSQEKLKEAYFSKYKLAYDKNYTEFINPLYNASNFGKIITFPLCYFREDEINLVYDIYKLILAPGYNYNYLTGTEVIQNKQLDEYRLWCHTKAADVAKEGLLYGNMLYLEDNWKVLVNPMLYCLRNTDINMWNNGVPVFVNDLKNGQTGIKLPDDVSNIYIDNNSENKLKSVKIKDKYIKIRVRYSGKNLALISAINTLYTVSYG